MCGITICKLHGYVKCCTLIGNCCCSVAKSHLTLRPHGLQHARPPCLSPSPRVCSNSFPLSCWCHPTISSSVTHVLSYLKSFLASRSSLISWLLAWGGQGIADSVSASGLSNEYSGFTSSRIDWFISLLFRGLSRVPCHFLLQCMKVRSETEVTQSCPTLCDPMDCSLPGSSVHGIFQARVLEWGAIAFSVAEQ